jgi:S-adenosylmethionine synthetase
MLKTAENVTMGHPDKVCDQISDAILDACLEQDPNSRVAVETMGGHGKLFILGELTTTADIDAASIAQKLYEQIGYQDKLDIQVNLVKQSPDIAQGVDTGGAGDQGIMVGYATTETAEMLPLEHVLATRLVRRLEEVRQDSTWQLSKYLLPDGKAQVTLNNDKVETVVISTQHTDDIALDDLRQLVIKEVIAPIISDYKNVFINPAGAWHLGGFAADTGLTGRKITADNYGPQIPVGGGCFAGKDASKVDRSAAYMARYLATKYLQEMKAKEVLVKLAYAIGKKEPVMATAEVDGRIVEIKDIDLSPQGIIDFLCLKEPQYLLRARHGFFQDFKIKQ